MTAPLGTMVPSLVVNPTLIPSLQAQTLTLPETSRVGSARYVVAGSMAMTALGTVLAGCRSDPAPAPIPHESALPPNQGNCPPGSRDPFCMGYRESVGEMHRMREEGHHSDQALTALLVGGAVLITGITAFFLGRWRGKKAARRRAEQAQTQPVHEPPAASANAAPKIPKIGE